MERQKLLNIICLLGLVIMIVSAVMMSQYRKRNDDKSFTISGVFLGVGLVMMFVTSAMSDESRTSGWFDRSNQVSSNAKIREINLGPFHYERS